MRAVMLGVAVAAAVFGIDRVAPAQTAAQVAEVVTKTREALGGETRLAGVGALTVEGAFRRSMGSNDIAGTIKLTLGVPGRIRHEEELQLPTGARVTRLAGMNGDHVWEDTSTRGAPGGAQIVIRGSGPGLGSREADPDAMRQMQQRRLTAIYERMALALLASSGDELSYAGIAEVGDRQVDVLEKTDLAGHPVRLLISRDTNMPIAISYMEVRPTMIAAGGPGMMAGRGGGGFVTRGQAGPLPGGQVRTEMEAPPPSTVIIRLEDYRAVDGIQLPHLLVQVVDGEPFEEWTIRRYQVNPRLGADVFDKR